MAKSFHINGEYFKTKTSATKRVQQLLEKYDFDSRIEGEDFSFFVDLIKLHEKAAEKIGIGIKELWVRKCKMNEENKTLKIIRGDLTDTHVSWRKCLTPPKGIDQVREAARCDIDPQVSKFREKTFCGRETVECEETGEEIGREHCHIDHAHPKTFDKPFEDWSIQEKINPEDIKIEDVGGHGWKTFMDEALRDSWCKFHEQNMELRAIIKGANLGLGNRPSWDKKSI
jgi:hypothetical protein